MASGRDERGFGWTDPEWRAAAEAWIRTRCTVVGSIEQPHVEPWGTVLRVPTTEGPVWFKACVLPLAYEIALLEILGGLRSDCLPRVLAADRERGWMLLEDAGARFREHDWCLEGWEQYLAAYAQFQLDVAPSADALVRAGVPDLRTPAMFERLATMLEDERNLYSSPSEFVSREQVSGLRERLPWLRELAEELDALGAPASAQHDDLHQWNVFVRDGRYVFIDWGDACVSQPLLSLAVPLDHVPESFDERARLRVRDAYLEPWTAIATRAELVAACGSALLLAQVTSILKWSRIHAGIAPEHRCAYTEGIGRRAQVLLDAACA